MTLAALLLGACPRPAEAIYIRDDRTPKEHSAMAGWSAFAPVGYLADRDWGIAYSSGTLVSATKVLTAAHVVDSDGDLRIDDPAQFRRTAFGTRRDLPGKAGLVPNIASVAINPAYKGGASGYDLAVLTLTKPITAVKPARLSSAYAVGMRAALVGYGYQGTGTRDGLSGATDKLAATNSISRYEDSTYLTDFDNPARTANSFGSASPLINEGTTAPGDSGGPLYAEFGYDAWRVVGVLNGGYNERGIDSHYGDVSVYAALSDPKNVAFLRSQGLFINSTRSVGPDDVSAGLGGPRSIAVPEPATALPLLSIAGLFVRLRSKPHARSPVPSLGTPGEG